ncbi:hypothetical protein TGFOU_236160B, partial [Toxoplasma gondii FOU]
VFVSAFLPDSVDPGEEEEESQCLVFSHFHLYLFSFDACGCQSRTRPASLARLRQFQPSRLSSVSSVLLLSSQSLFAGDELDWRALRERPFLLKLWLRDRIRAVHLALVSVASGEAYDDVKRSRGTSSSRKKDGKGNEGEEEGDEEEKEEEEGATGRWTIESLFVHVEKREEGDEKSSGGEEEEEKKKKKSKVLIAVKGNPYDNPDIDPLIKVEGSSRTNRHPVGAFLLFLLLLLLCRQTFSEIRGAIDRAACYQYLSYFSQVSLTP